MVLLFILRLITTCGNFKCNYSLKKDLKWMIHFTVTEILVAKIGICEVKVIVQDVPIIGLSFTDWVLGFFIPTLRTTDSRDNDKTQCTQNTQQIVTSS